MDHSMHTPLTTEELTQDNLVDAPIYGTDDSTIGTVSHVHGMGAGLQVVLDVGGFLGIGAHTVAIPADRLEFMRDESGDIHALTHLTKEELKSLPEHHDH